MQKTPTPPPPPLPKAQQDPKRLSYATGAGIGCAALMLLFLCCGVIGMVVPQSNSVRQQTAGSSGSPQSAGTEPIVASSEGGVTYSNPNTLESDSDFARILNGDRAFSPLGESIDRDRALDLMAVCVYAQLMSNQGRHVKADPSIVKGMMRSSAILLGCQQNTSMRYLMEIEPDWQFDESGLGALQYGSVMFQFKERPSSIVVIEAVMIRGDVYSLGNR